ncbi:MAG TPA: hypothetical protein VMB80_06145 [Candidatus Acidoferrum sp.]|nr:hypothetical protein [Candidatus Acidoferrum sp.]
MRQLSAIVFGLTLVWAQLLVPGLPACAQPPHHACCRCGGKMSCCAPKSAGSQPVSTVPSRPATQNQFSFPIWDSPAWTLPAGPICPPSSIAMSPGPVAVTPLYARDCARLI